MPIGKKRNKKEKEKQSRTGIKEKVVNALELPKEIMLDMPRLTMIGKGSLLIENYKGVIEYGSSRVRINSGIGVVRVSGELLLIREITSEDIVIEGKIQSVEFLE